MVSKRSTKKKEDLVSALSETIWNQVSENVYVSRNLTDTFVDSS